MIKKSIIFSVSIFASVIAVNANASLLSGTADSGKVLGTTTSITPNNEPLAYDSVAFLVGYSVVAPCSDLQVVREIHNDNEKSHPIEPMTMEATSDGYLSFGSGLTCFKVDSFVDAKQYSTGNIMLTWEESTHEYTAMSPRNVVMDFTK